MSPVSLAPYDLHGFPGQEHEEDQSRPGEPPNIRLSSVGEYSYYEPNESSRLSKAVSASQTRLSIHSFAEGDMRSGSSERLGPPERAASLEGGLIDELLNSSVGRSLMASNNNNSPPSHDHGLP